MKPDVEQDVTPAVGLLLLAAGTSARLGEPKQLLRYQGQSLLRRAALAASATECHPLIVVLGAHAAELRAELNGLPVQVAEHTDWAEGMGLSIRVGLSAVNTVAPATSAVVVMLCDQPLVTTNEINALITAHRLTGQPIIVAAYNGTRGVPALFDRQLFPALLALSGAQGAKKVIAAHSQLVYEVDMPRAAMDIDTRDDYERLLSSKAIVRC